MRTVEQGFLLLTCTLGDAARHPLTVAQLRTLTERMKQMPLPVQNRELTIADLASVGCSEELAQRVLGLLSDTQLLERYLKWAQRMDCFPLTRINSGYPGQIRKKLDAEAPGCLWAKGDTALLETPMIGLVGSRNIRPENAAFAREVGIQAAKQGYTLVSGNARGADKTAQEACLVHGGRVICVCADSLTNKVMQKNVLYISEEDFDAAFSAQRAHSRNRLIHCLGAKIFVAQTDVGRGGTWRGTVKNLNRSWRDVFCIDDDPAGAKELALMGSSLISIKELNSISALCTDCLV